MSNSAPSDDPILDGPTTDEAASKGLIATGPARLSPLTTGNLVLKTRLALVIRNLEIVRQALAQVEGERATLRKLVEFPGVAAEAVESLLDELQTADYHLARNDLDALQDDLDAHREQLADLQSAIHRLRAPADRLRSTMALRDAPPPEEDDEPAPSAVEQSLKDAIDDEFGVELEKLRSLQARVIPLTHAGSTSPPDLAGAWDDYTGELLVSSARLFGEYVELVSGIAMRDSGFDRGISRLAEDLLNDGKTIGNFTLNAMTIPAREEALAVTAARIVRLGFPDWTIWTLPLAAYELGSNYADFDKKVGERIKALDGDSEELLVLVADAFATYMLGPAYAAAAILMRLDPAKAFAGGRLVAKRAATILVVLSRMSTVNSGVSDHLRNSIDRLVDEWCEALLQTGWSGQVIEDDTVAPAAGGAGGPYEDLRLRTGLTSAELAEILRLIDRFHPLVSGWIDLNVDEMWPAVETAAAKLRDGAVLAAEDLPRRAKQRFLVNVAWRARIAATGKEKDVDDPQRLTKIAQTVKERMQDFVADAPLESSKPPRRTQGPPRSKTDRTPTTTQRTPTKGHTWSRTGREGR